MREDSPDPTNTCEKEEGGERGIMTGQRELEVAEDEGGNGEDKEEESEQGH